MDSLYGPTIDASNDGTRLCLYLSTAIASFCIDPREKEAGDCFVALCETIENVPRLIEFAALSGAVQHVRFVVVNFADEDGDDYSSVSTHSSMPVVNFGDEDGDDSFSSSTHSSMPGYVIKLISV